MFIALSCFTIDNDMSAEVRAAFAQRPHRVDAVPGFVSMEVMSPTDNAQEVWLLTRWRDQASYTAWHSSDEYHASHAGIPKGLKLVPGSARVHLLDVFAT